MTKDEKEIIIANYYSSNEISPILWNFEGFPAERQFMDKKHDIDSLRFTTSTDWIVPVWDKIIREGISVYVVAFIGNYIVQVKHGESEVVSTRALNLIDAFVEAALRYIEWKNKQIQ